jgi:two-component system LytT family response regulator
VYTQEEEYTMPMSITEFDALLPVDLFFRCHRSYTVNLTKIREIVPWFNQTYMLRLKNLPEEIPVSRSKVKAFRQIMHL